MVQEKGYDESVIDRFLDLGGKEFIIKMIDLFIKNAANRIEEAKEGQRMDNFSAIQQAVHSLQSSAGNFGSVHMVELSRTIEQHAKEQKKDDIPTLLRELEDYFQLIKTNLEEEKKRFA